MRTDLPVAFTGAKDSAQRKPRQLLVVHFPVAGDIYLSDQPLGSADGLDHDYLPLVEDWGVLTDVVGDATDLDAGFIRQLSLTLWNGGNHPFSDYFTVEPPEFVEASLYQWFYGTSDADKVLIDRFVLQDPIQFTESSRLLQLDMVGIAIRWDQPVGTALAEDEWPHVLPEYRAKGLPLAVGSPGQIPAIKATTALSATLANSILSGATVVPVNENLTTLDFATTGTIQIGQERIGYTNISTHSFTGCSRGIGGTEPNQHLRNEKVIEHLPNHIFLLCEGPVQQISNVLIDGFPAPAGTFTVDALANPARVIFGAQPWYERFSAGSKFLEMQFDAVAPGNTALTPAYAFDVDETSSSAVISNSHKVLAIKQDTVNQDRGQIRKAYLSVAHWESGLMGNDYVQVAIDGIGNIGRLAKPNSSDVFAIDGDVDIDHGHLHSTGAAHTHTTVDPDFNSSSPSHDHDLGVTTTELTTDISSFPIGQWITKTYNGYWTVDHITFPHYPNSGVWVLYDLEWDYITPNYCVPDIELHMYIGGSWHTINMQPGSHVVYVGQGSFSGDPYIRYKPSTNHTTKFRLNSCAIKWHANNSISSKQIAISTTKSQTGYVLGQGADANDDPIKASDDVHDLTTGNMPLNINAQDNPSRTIVDKFDITDSVNFDWSWFTGKSVTMTYVSTGANKDVHVLHAFFMVEFSPREVVFSDSVGASVTAILTKPVAVIKYLLTTKAGVSENDVDMADADTTYTALNYTLDGLIDAELTIADAIRKICWQIHGRIFTSGGLVKLIARSNAISPQKSIGNTDRQLKSIAITRQPMSEVKNSINLAYTFDWVNDEYCKSVTSEEQNSIRRFGKRGDVNGYRFDLIRDDDMAEAVASYYCFQQAWPDTFYSFTAYLGCFELEAEDCVALSGNFHNLESQPVTVCATERVFASGKKQQINHIKIVAKEVFTYVSGYGVNTFGYGAGYYGA